jgi:hypothetical protein
MAGHRIDDAAVRERDVRYARSPRDLVVDAAYCGEEHDAAASLSAFMMRGTDEACDLVHHHAARTLDASGVVPAPAGP